MISEPGRYLPAFLKAGCDLVTFHVEAVPDPVPLLKRIRDAGAAAGLALNPETPIDAVRPALPWCDAVLVMSVEPGFGGQKFMPVALDKLRALRSLVGENTCLSIDGGIDLETIGPSREAGAHLFVAGSAIFDTHDYREALSDLRLAAGGAAVSAPAE
jgi:ribulose-phosphate 3-epimerase